MASEYYESQTALEQYLLFHYGTPEQISPLFNDVRRSCGFPARCVSEPMENIPVAKNQRALDLGCAVGRSSLELGKFFSEVVGIDFSEKFVAAARRMAEERKITVHIPREGKEVEEIRLELPVDAPTERVKFEQGDACALRADLGTFNLVLMANLIDRLPDPARCLAQMPELLADKGWLIITSPYTWMEDYTPRDKWLQKDDGGTLEALKEILAENFELHRVLNMPFLIREHQRKYQWCIAEASVWQKH